MPRENVTPNINYIRRLYAKQDALLERLTAALPAEFAGWQVAPEEGKLLQLLITLRGVRTVVEIGTLAGYSAIWMARALPQDGHLYTLGKDPAHNALAKKFIGESDVADRITLIEGDARDTLPTLQSKGPFDMVFIDADKLAYPDYLDWAEANLRPGGLVVGDNTLLFDAAALDAPPEGTAPATWNAMRRFNERLADEKNYFAMMIPTAEGLSVAIKRL
jgi:predicted O-methyltransferase YrrM